MAANTRLSSSTLVAAQLSGTFGRPARNVRGRPSLDRLALDHLFANHIVSDLAQLPALWALPGPRGAPPYVSDVDFDGSGELLASCSTDGRIAVFQAQQFAATLQAAHAHAERAAEEALALQLASEERAGGSAHAAAIQAAAVAAAKAAEVAHHTVACEPLLCISTRQSACATRWSPHARDELVCAYANAHELHVFDLGSATPNRPVRRLRSAKAYAATQGVADVAFPPGGAFPAASGRVVLAGGRDGQLRVWDVRAPQPLVAQATTATGGFTLGVRAQDAHAGAIHVLCAAPDGARVYAGTDEGCVVAWDVRALQTTLKVVRVGRALASAARSTAEGVVGLSHHPSLRHILCSQLSGGCAILVDAEEGAIRAVRPAPRPPPPDAATLPDSEGLVPLGARAAIGAAGGAAGGAPPDWRVRTHRGAFLESGGGDVWWCTGLAGTSDLTSLRVRRYCTELSAARTTPTSAPVVAVSAHPQGRLLAVGLRDNSIGLVAPCAHVPALPLRLDEGPAEAAGDGAQIVAPPPRSRSVAQVAVEESAAPTEVGASKQTHKLRIPSLLEVGGAPGASTMGGASAVGLKLVAPQRIMAAASAAQPPTYAAMPVLDTALDEDEVAEVAMLERVAADAAATLRGGRRPAAVRSIFEPRADDAKKGGAAGPGALPPSSAELTAAASTTAAATEPPHEPPSKPAPKRQRQSSLADFFRK